jgi:hypothetical protein
MYASKSFYFHPKNQTYITQGTQGYQGYQGTPVVGLGFLKGRAILSKNHLLRPSEVM